MCGRARPVREVGECTDSERAPQCVESSGTARLYGGALRLVLAGSICRVSIGLDCDFYLVPLTILTSSTDGGSIPAFSPSVALCGPRLRVPVQGKAAG